MYEIICLQNFVRRWFLYPHFRSLYFVDLNAEFYIRLYKILNLYNYNKAIK